MTRDPATEHQDLKPTPWCSPARRAALWRISPSGSSSERMPDLRFQHATTSQDLAIESLVKMSHSAAIIPMGTRDSCDGEERRRPASVEHPIYLEAIWQPQRGSNPCLHLERVVS